MNRYRIILAAILIMVIAVAGNRAASAADKLTLSTSGDFVSRYIWRGTDYGDAMAIQPALALNYKGLDLGIWGSYSSGYKEIDTWASYTYKIPNSLSLCAIATDYYFPDSLGELFNYNNYDDPAGPGAHVIELGLIVTGPEKFPIEVSAYMNVYNDRGNSIFLEANYPITINGTAVGLFAGATPGNKDNPWYYGSRDFVFLNVGAKVSREIKFSEEFSLPVFGSIIVNPNSEDAFLIFGFTL